MSQFKIVGKKCSRKGILDMKLLNYEMKFVGFKFSCVKFYNYFKSFVCSNSLPNLYSITFLLNQKGIVSYKRQSRHGVVCAGVCCRVEHIKQSLNQPVIARGCCLSHKSAVPGGPVQRIYSFHAVTSYLSCIDQLRDE